MFVRSKQVAVLTLVLAIPALALAAAPTNKAEKVAQGMLKFDQSLSEATAQIDRTLNAMNAMTKPESKLVDDYKVFTKEVDNLDKMAQKAKANSEKMNAQRDEYLKEWQASQANIQNAQLKASSEARRAELAPKIEAIKGSFASASATFKPFMQDLKDLRVFLGNSLNPSGVASASELMTKCNTDGASVKADIQKGSAALKDLAGSIQPGGAPPAKK
jgi:chromosome segregation ATPase